MVTFWALVKTIAMWVKLLRLLFGATFAKLGLLFISTSGHTAHDIDHCKTFSCYKQARLVVPKFDRTDPCKILMQYFRVCTFPVKPVFPPKRESVVTSKRKRKQQSTLFAIHKFNLPHCSFILTERLIKPLNEPWFINFIFIVEAKPS